LASIKPKRNAARGDRLPFLYFARNSDTPDLVEIIRLRGLYDNEPRWKPTLENLNLGLGRMTDVTAADR
jgi:hypothetical protein